MALIIVSITRFVVMMWRASPGALMISIPLKYCSVSYAGTGIAPPAYLIGHATVGRISRDFIITVSILANNYEIARMINLLNMAQFYGASLEGSSENNAGVLIYPFPNFPSPFLGFDRKDKEVEVGRIC